MRIVSESIEQLAGRIGEDLQKLEDLLESFGDKKMKVRFPRGFLRTALTSENGSGLSVMTIFSGISVIH